MKVTAEAPAVSATVVGTGVIVKAAVSLLVTLSVSVPDVRPVAAAVKDTVASASTVVLSIAAMLTVTDADPIGMVTVAGTVDFDGLDDVRFTSRATAVDPLRVTVIVVAVAPAFSATESAATTMVKVGLNNAAAAAAFANFC